MVKDGIDKTDSAVLKMLHIALRKNTDFEDLTKYYNLIPCSVSYEFDPLAKEKAKQKVGEENKQEDDDKGGTMRLGAQNASLLKGSLARSLYKNKTIFERHRHRYEVNPNYVPMLENKGLVVSARSEVHNLVEMIELKDHPWFLGCQFHPEFTSKPKTGHPLFNDFIKTAVKLKNKK